MKVLGREPTLWLNLVAALIAATGAFVIHLGPEQEGVLNAIAFAVMGVIIAAMTHDGLSAAVLGFFKTLVALAAAFGLHLDAAHQTILLTLVAAVTSMFIRTQVTAPVGPPPR